MAKKIRTSFSLSEQALTLLAELADKKGLSKASTLETLIREAAKEQGITPPPAK